MKKLILKNLIREAIKEVHNNPFRSDGNPLQEGPMGAAKKCGRCLDSGKCCKVSGTSSNPIVDCEECGPRRVDMDKGMRGPMG